MQSVKATPTTLFTTGGTGPVVHDEGGPPESRDGGEEQSLPAAKRVCRQDHTSGIERASVDGELPTLTTHVPQQHRHLQQSGHQPLYCPPTHPPSYPPHQVQHQFPCQPLVNPHNQPFHYPSPHPPPFPLPVGPPYYQATSPPVQPFQAQISCMYQPPYQHPLQSPYQPPVEPIHVYPPPLQPSYQPSSQPTPHPDTPLGKYSLYLRDYYKLHKAPSTKWPYLDAQKYINLAVISNEYTNREELKKFREQTIHGSIDDILEWKSPIEIKDILQPNQEKHGQGVIVRHPITQLLIEGAPGIGKSTFAWEVCQKWGQHQLFNEYSLVVLLKFRDKRVQNAESVSDLFYHPLAKLRSEIVGHICCTGGHGLLVILEGFDEAPASKRVMDTVFVRLFSGQELPKATVILTTRPSASAELRILCRGSHSRRIEIVGFGKKEIDQYIECAFSDEQSLSGFTKYLSLYPHIHTLMYVPLNSAIVVEVFKSCSSSGTAVPKTMTQLYSSLMRSLLLRYLKDKQEYRDTCTSINSFKDLPQPVCHRFHGICKLAYMGIMSAETELIFHDLPSDFDPLGLMQTCPELYVDSGACVSYNMLHFTVQEYLAAYYISQLSKDEQVAFMKEHINNKKLGVVVRFLAGFSLSELGQDLWDVVRGQHVLSGEKKSVKLQILHWLFESQDPSSITRILGLDSMFFFHSIFQHGALLPFDWYVLGYCITHSSCDWELQLDHCKLESVETFLNVLNVQQDQFLLPLKGQIKEMVLWGFDPAALHLLVTNLPQMSVFHNLTHLCLSDLQNMRPLVSRYRFVTTSSAP